MKASFGMFLRMAKIAVFFAALWGMGIILTASSALSAAGQVESLLSTGECPKCDLAKASLAKAKLKKANLEGANLMSADLSDADLEDANLMGANLRQANMTGANLKGAFCRLTNFEGARMPDGAPFSIANNPKKYGCRR